MVKKKQENNLGYKALIITLIFLLTIPITIMLVKEKQNISTKADLADRTSNVGHEVKTISYQLPNGTNKQLTFAVWYPTNKIPSKYGYNRILPSGRVALNAPVKKITSGYPLIVFSHGFSGCGYQSSALMEYLASYGYVVAAPDHEDKSLCSIRGKALPAIKAFPTGSFTRNYPNRPTDIEAVINQMLGYNQDSTSEFYNSINKDEIGLLGHSLGGWTTYAVNGAIAQYKDSRIKALGLYAPALMDYSAKEIKNVTTPVIYILAANDQFLKMGLLNPGNSSYPYAATPKYLGVLANADHYTFSDMECTRYMTTTSCLRNNSKIATIAQYTKAFFDKYLYNDNTANTLKTTVPAFTSYTFLEQ